MAPLNKQLWTFITFFALGLSLTFWYQLIYSEIDPNSRTQTSILLQPNIFDFGHNNLSKIECKKRCPSERKRRCDKPRTNSLNSPVYNFTQVDAKARPLNLWEVRKNIGYPNIAKKAGLEGVVVLEVLVNEDGKFMDYRTISDPHPILTYNVVRNLNKLRFSPAKIKNKRVRSWVKVPFVFEL